MYEAFCNYEIFNSERFWEGMDWIDLNIALLYNNPGLPGLALYLWLNMLSAIWGYKEGILYAMKGADSFPWNEHRVFVYERIVFLIVLFYTYLMYEYMWYYIAAILFMWLLAFPFWHDGFYFEARRKIDAPPGYWFGGDSKTSTAKLEIKWTYRFVLKLISLALLLWYLSVNWNSN